MIGVAWVVLFCGLGNTGVVCEEGDYKFKSKGACEFVLEEVVPNKWGGVSERMYQCVEVRSAPDCLDRSLLEGSRHE